LHHDAINCVAAVQRLVWLILAGLVLEVYLASVALFGTATFQPRRAVGVALAAAILLLLVLMLVARLRRHAVGLAPLAARTIHP
jgi:hypothetical protein